jgi:ribosome-associated protein
MSKKIQITNDFSISENDLQFDFIRASGPGGQNVNKVSSAVQLRFDIRTPSLPEHVRLQLYKLAKNQITKENILIIEASRYRTQEQNRQDAVERLVALLQEAAAFQKKRIKTTPTPTSIERRLDSKRRRSDIKKSRRSVPNIDE